MERQWHRQHHRVIGGNGGTCGNVHRDRRGAAANDGDTNNDDTTDDNNAVGDADDILC
jgi:hypothetical protein